MIISKQAQQQIQTARETIILDDLSSIAKRYHKILSFDPSEIYNRLEGLINPFKRRQSVGMEELFPSVVGKCACGCGKELTGRRRRWATDECIVLPSLVLGIINGDTQVIRPIIAELHGGQKCFICGRKDEDFKRNHIYPEHKKNMTSEERELWNKQWRKIDHEGANKIHLDHILPVHQGGGGCWLSNWNFLCVDCHKVKTREEKKRY